MTPWGRYGSAERMIALNRNVFFKLHDHIHDTLKGTVAVPPRDLNDSGNHFFDTATVTNADAETQQHCYTIPVMQNSFISDRQRTAIEELFPFNIGNMRFEFCTIFDYDYDEERSWKPKIAFTIVETSLEQTRNDQIFIYWDA